MRPVLRYFGGKFRLADWISGFFPAHRVYIEPFGGAASVLMQKAPAYAEVYNDLDESVVNVFRVLRNTWTARKLRILLERTPFSRQEFNHAYDFTLDPVERARRTIILAFMGHGAPSASHPARTGFRGDSNRSGTTPAHDWAAYPPSIADFCDRIRRVVIEQMPAINCIEKYDCDDALIYADPPYVHDTRSSGHGYRYEMTDTEHERLMDVLRSCKGSVVLSGYNCPIYEKLGWKRFDKEAFADGAVNKLESVWLNPKCASRQNQMSLDEAMA